MADFVYTESLADLMSGDIDLDTDDIRCRLVMTNTTADTDEDAATWGAFTTDDEMDGASYAAVALTTEAVTADTTNDRGKFDADDVTFSSLGVGTRNVLAVVVVKFVDGGDADIPIFYIDSGFSPPSGVAANGGDFKVTWHADGIAYSFNP